MKPALPGSLQPMNKKITIVGHGFVGQAVDYGFTHPDVTKTIIDPKYSEFTVLPDTSDAIFVCVPTPMMDNGEIDTTILDSVMDDLFKRTTVGSTIVIKSTVTPAIIKKYDRAGVVYNPEFLTERSANEQFVDPAFHILGGHPKSTAKIQALYADYSLCNPTKTFHTTMEEASFIKYAINSFLALKVTFFNQLYDAVGETDANFTRIINAVGSDPRIGHSHTKVPGFDGKQGFGGACFPKDVSALIKSTNMLTILEECVNINNQYRNKYEKDEREITQNIQY
jgi:UDPglucose 6-dehydrogenase